MKQTIMINQALPKTLFAFVWHFLKKQKITVWLYVSIAFIAGLWGPINSYLVKSIIDFLPKAQAFPETLSILLCLIPLNFMVFDNFTWRTIDWIKYKKIPYLLNQMDLALFDYTLQHSHQFFQDKMSGSLSKQIFTFIDGVEKIISSSLVNMLRGSCVLISCFVVSYFVNPLFSVIMLIWFIAFFIVSYKMANHLADLSKVQAETESIIGGQIIDSFTNQSTINLFSKRDYEINRRLPYLNSYVTAYQNKGRYDLKMSFIQATLIALMSLGSVYGLFYFYQRQQISAGDFALIIGLSMELGHMIWWTMFEYAEFNKAVGRCRQGLESLLVPHSVIDQNDATVLKVIKGDIRFQNVHYRYQKAKALFEDTSIHIREGQKVGLVGYSGGGKTTFVNLILRLFDVNDGSILIDDQNIKNVTQESLHENIAMIPQEPLLFHRSLMDNIRYGRTDASDEEVIDASQKAHAHEFISLLPQGYESLVGERGIKLSGGQRQRIAIARAILKNAPILILDEATSQLDSVTENLIQDSLWNLMQNKTAIVIAHRLSTLLHMDRILVFDKGKIVEDGTHLDLLTQSGLYKNLWDAQVGGFLRDEIKENQI